VPRAQRGQGRGVRKGWWRRSVWHPGIIGNVMAAELQVRCGAFPETGILSRNAALSIITISDRDAWKFVGVPTVSSIHTSPHRIKCRHPAARRNDCVRALH
jgi:hypothetical protein